MKLLRENKKIISLILIALVIYFRCDFGVVKTLGKGLNLVIDAIAFIYCLYLTKEDFQSTKKSLCNIAMLWLIIFLVIEFVYGHFGLFYNTEMYSRQYTILTILPTLLVYEMLWHNKGDLIDILSKVGSLVIIATFITNVKYDHLWGYVLKGDFYRLGEVPGGTVIDTGNLYMLMLIPVLYAMIVKKEKIKLFIVPAMVGIVGILLTGSRSSAMPLVIVIAIMGLSASKNKQTLKRNIIILLALFIISVVLVMTVPVLYEVLGSRFVEIFDNFGAKEYDLKTSTGQRMAVWQAFKQHFWEAPLFGHGFYAFKSMPYSQLEMYHENGETLFRNIQTHMNFLELLFSFGVFGFIAYYWYPVKLCCDTIKSQFKSNKILAISFLTSIFFMDLGLDMFFNYMTPYYVYLLLYILVGAKDAQEER